jgi:hypothetical protein
MPFKYISTVLDIKSSGVCCYLCVYVPKSVQIPSQDLYPSYPRIPSTRMSSVTRNETQCTVPTAHGTFVSSTPRLSSTSSLHSTHNESSPGARMHNPPDIFLYRSSRNDRYVIYNFTNRYLSHVGTVCGPREKEKKRQNEQI